MAHVMHVEVPDYVGALLASKCALPQQNAITGHHSYGMPSSLGLSRLSWSDRESTWYGPPRFLRPRLSVDGTPDTLRRCYLVAVDP